MLLLKLLRMWEICCRCDMYFNDDILKRRWISSCCQCLTEIEIKLNNHCVSSYYSLSFFKSKALFPPPPPPPPPPPLIWFCVVWWDIKIKEYHPPLSFIFSVLFVQKCYWNATFWGQINVKHNVHTCALTTFVNHSHKNSCYTKV